LAPKLKLKIFFEIKHLRENEMTKKILVVDDSALMRKKLVSMLEERTNYEIRTARDGQDAIEQVRSWRPDAVTLDINMPVMDGLTCLALIMEDAPCPVLMVSSLTEKGALSTFEALQLGAIDYVAKPGGTVSLNIDDVADEIIDKVETALKSKIRKSRNLSSRLKVANTSEEKFIPNSNGVVLIGVSTGGPSTLEEILTALPIDFPLPIVIAQHMPSRFTRVFAQRLNSVCKLNVSHVDKRLHLLPGNIYIARGDADISIIKRANKYMALSVPECGYLWHPSVEKMVESALSAYQPKEIIAVMLTGMGNDGAKVMAEVKEKGGKTIAESEETAVVYGMPRELIQLNGASKILPCNKIAEQLINWTR
jgi:two-component system chemotaxis response regulator CheB